MKTGELKVKQKLTISIFSALLQKRRLDHYHPEGRGRLVGGYPRRQDRLVPLQLRQRCERTR